MNHSSEHGPRCACGLTAEIIAPGRARCSGEAVGPWRKPCGREFEFTIETRKFYVVDLELAYRAPQYHERRA
jgi:hypothetical protein